MCSPGPGRQVVARTVRRRPRIDHAMRLRRLAYRFVGRAPREELRSTAARRRRSEKTVAHRFTAATDP
jgi:hypothetical protein